MSQFPRPHAITNLCVAVAAVVLLVAATGSLQDRRAVPSDTLGPLVVRVSGEPIAAEGNQPLGPAGEKLPVLPWITGW